MVALQTLIKDKVNSMNLSIQVRSVVGDRLYVCKTLHLSIGKIIRDSSNNQYRVIDFQNDEWIEIEPITENAPDPYEDTIAICPDVFFLFGTPSSVNSEYHQINKSAKNKMPLIWLNEVFEEENPLHGSSVERIVTPTIYFLDEANEDRWNNEEQKRYVIQPMQNLCDHFYRQFASDRMFKKIATFRKIPRSRFGVYVDNRGNDRKVLDEFVSAVETRPTLIRYKTMCKC